MLANLSTILALTSVVFAASAPPKLTFLYQANLTISGNIDIGTVPLGTRAVISVNSGAVDGPRIKGKIVLGADWGLTDSKGVFQPDAFYIIETDDGAKIFVTAKGRAPGGNVLFETGSEKYNWLNNAVAYETGGFTEAGDLGLEVWQLGE